MKTQNINLKELLQFTLDTSYEAGDILIKFQKERQELLITDKGIDGIASEADQKSEDFILDKIRTKYPSHTILSEEDYSKNKTTLFSDIKESEFLWVIDPLDGTNNFVNGIPIYAVSIALLHLGDPIIGVVYNPTSGECFHASKGGGAYLIDFKINPFKKYSLFHKDNTKEMGECIFSPAPTYEKKSSTVERFEEQLSVFKKNILGCRAVRRLGSAALELCYVANGNFDGYWEKHLKPWDVAAAGLICQEANVQLTDFNGQEYTPFDQSILAAVNPLHRRILGKINT
jgi:myo-inositol-1(or 4)-monophosphatase